jgi:hypothetical protein
MIWAVLAISTVALQAHVRAASGRSIIMIIGRVTFRDWERNGTISCTRKHRDQRYMGGSAAGFIELQVSEFRIPQTEQFGK